MVAGVLFDLGGTLLDYEAHGTWEETLNASYLAVHRELTEVGYRGDPAAFGRLMFDLEERLWQEARFGWPAREKPTAYSVVAETLGEVRLPPEPALVERCVRAYARSLQDKCVAYPDSAEALAALRSRGLRIGLISNTTLPGEAHVADLARFGLLKHFDDLVFSSDAGLWKPQPEVFRLALRRLGLRPEEAAFVGDRLHDDVGGAQGVGMLGILVERPRGDRDAPREDQGISPDYRLRTLADLPALIAGLERGDRQ